MQIIEDAEENEDDQALLSPDHDDGAAQAGPDQAGAWNDLNCEVQNGGIALKGAALEAMKERLKVAQLEAAKLMKVSSKLGWLLGVCLAMRRIYPLRLPLHYYHLRRRSITSDQ